ncbi:MAG: hypothetical protein M3R41_00295 [Pseudomonadota bacterium]|nr:hypothetical protein [Pseudomonadota bacterium]
MSTATIERFQYDADPAALHDLDERLKRVIWPDEVRADPWHYGPPVDYMKASLNIG